MIHRDELFWWLLIYSYTHKNILHPEGRTAEIASEDTTYKHIDQLPPFNLSLLFSNELGYTSCQRILSVEFHHIQWELQANLIPKYGYCSFKFDDVAQGKSLVQGQLVVNFVSPGYLIGALLGKQSGNVELSSDQGSLSTERPRRPRASGRSRRRPWSAAAVPGRCQRCRPAGWEIGGMGGQVGYGG